MGPEWPVVAEFSGNSSRILLCFKIGHPKNRYGLSLYPNPTKVYPRLLVGGAPLFWWAWTGKPTGKKPAVLVGGTLCLVGLAWSPRENTRRFWHAEAPQGKHPPFWSPPFRRSGKPEANKLRILAQNVQNLQEAVESEDEELLRKAILEAKQLELPEEAGGYRCFRLGASQPSPYTVGGFSFNSLKVKL